MSSAGAPLSLPKPGYSGISDMLYSNMSGLRLGATIISSTPMPRCVRSGSSAASTAVGKRVDTRVSPGSIGSGSRRRNLASCLVISAMRCSSVRRPAAALLRRRGRRRRHLLLAGLLLALVVDRAALAEPVDACQLLVHLLGDRVDLHRAALDVSEPGLRRV